MSVYIQSRRATTESFFLQINEDIFIETPRYASAPGGVDQIVISRVSQLMTELVDIDLERKLHCRVPGSVSAASTGTASQTSQRSRRTTTEETTQ